VVSLTPPRYLTGRARAVCFQIGGGLLGDHRSLHALEQGFGFGERQPEGFGPQLTPFELRHLFDTWGLPMLRFNDDLDPDFHEPPPVIPTSTPHPPKRIV
jgi:hypothetical protein